MNFSNPYLLSIYPSMWKVQDLVLAPIFLMLIYLIGNLLKSKLTRRKPWTRKYFMPALSVRLLACILSIWMYDFYYDGGDMTGYYHTSETLAMSIFENMSFFFEVYIKAPSDISVEALSSFTQTSTAYYVYRESTLMVAKIGAILYLLSFGSIYGIGFFISLFSFLGTWKLFEVFTDYYPEYYRYLAISTLFIPSMCFWGGAGLMKDPIVLGLLGFLIFTFYRFFIVGNKNIGNLVIILMSSYLIFVIKSYVVLSVLPALVLWLIFDRQSKIINSQLRRLATPVIFSVAVVAGSIILISISSMTQGRFSSLDSVLQYAHRFQIYSEARTEEYGGSGYSLGSFEPSIESAISFIPKAFNVSLFRPYLWEAKKMILIPTAIESFLTLLFTLFVVLRVGLFRVIRKILSNPLLFFSMGFSTLFAIAVGMTSYNFGTLARYKILALPFYFSVLCILYLDSKRKFSRSGLHRVK